MPRVRVAPYGSWRSPITSDLVATGSVRFGQVALDGEDIYWVETRPSEGGRSVIVRHTPGGQTVDLNPPPYNARTRVHEYGGGAFWVNQGTVFFANFADQRLYRQEPGTQPRPITPEGGLRYADGFLDPRHKRIVCVREDHSVPGREPANTLVCLDSLKGGPGQVIASGHDFYSSPCLSPEGFRLAWLQWDHPNMPWDGCELWVGELTPDGWLGRLQHVAGGPGESIFQPRWSPDGVLHFVSDRNGWWNLYRWRNGRVEPLLEMEAEFGVPQWVLGLSTYAFESAERIVCAYNQRGTWRLGVLHTREQRLDPVDTQYTQIMHVQAGPGQAVFAAGSPTQPLAVVQLHLNSGRTDVLRRSHDGAVHSAYVSLPEAIEFPTSQGRTAYGFFYRPRNRDYAAPARERPPLLVKIHGGPTSATSTALDVVIQYWTSRGIAVLDVNYGGSTGYGRAYRQRLKGQWGLVDVDDCANGAQYLVERGDVDGERLAISGGSAGGYTTLCALTFRDLFKAGASYYGISDLEALARDTHKFESRYLDGLVGPYPERRDIYQARSPVHHAHRLSCPVIFFQGLEDQVVPPNQAEMMVQALRAKGLPVAYLTFEGEQHGFRKAESIKRCLDAELYFYARVFGFKPADQVEPVPIENL